jgi:AAA+ ATPase superfamily predicted ATPase
MSFSSYSDAFEYIFTRSENQRLAFVIVEYPVLVESWPGIPSLLQRLIDERKSNSRLFLIINGSSISLMEDYFSTYKKPLYGRKTCQLKVEPFGFFESCEFNPMASAENLLYIYGTFGGIPKYLEEYVDSLSFKENVIQSFLQKGAELFDEPQSILKQEVRDAASYNSILNAIAAGSTRYSEIAAQTKLGSSAVAGFISNLLSLNLIRKENPTPDSGSRRQLYELNDNMLLFWFRFIPDNMSLISMGKPEIAWRNIAAELDTYIGPVFEQIALEYLWKLNGNGQRLPFVFTEAGRWWGTNPEEREAVEIDIIAVSSLASDSTKALFGECKWHKKPVGADVLADLMDKAAMNVFDDYTEKWFILFSRKGFTPGCVAKAKNCGNVLLVEYSDMLEQVSSRRISRPRSA